VCIANLLAAIHREHATRANLYIDANHGFAGVLASSLQDSSPG